MTNANCFIPAKALEVLIKALGGSLYYHPKTGNVYRVIYRFCSGYLADEGEGQLGPLVPLTYADRIKVGDPVVFYQNIATRQNYIRLASKFDEKDRYIPLEELCGA